MSSMSGYNSLLHPDNRKELGTQGIFGQKESNLSSQPSRGKIQKFDKDISSDSSDLGGDFSKEELNATWQDVFGAKKTSTMLPIEILQDRGSGKSFTGLFDKMSGGSGEQMGSSIKSDTVSGGTVDKAFDSSLPSGQQSKVWQTSQIRHKDQARLGGSGKTFADVVAGTPVLDEGTVETAPNPFSVLEDEDVNVQKDHSWKENKLKDTDTVIDDTRKMADSARGTIKDKVNDLGIKDKVSDLKIKDKVSDLKVGATDTINQLSGKLQSGWQDVKNKKILKSDNTKLSGSSDISEDLHSKDVQKLAVIKSHDEITVHQKELKSELNKEVMEHGQDVIHHDTAGGIKQSFTGVVDKLSQKFNDTGIVDKISGVFSGSGDSKTTGTGIGNTISSGIGTVKQQASVLSTSISSKASDLGNKMGNQAMQIKEKAIGVTDNLQKKGQAKKQKKKLAADNGESSIGGIQQKGGELFQQAKVKVNDLSDTMSTKLQSTGFKQTLNDNFQSSRAMFDRFRAKAIPAIQPVVGDVIPTIRAYGTQYYQSLQSFVIELWQNPPYNKMLFNLIVFFNWICPLLFLHTKEAYTVLFGACISLLGQHLIQMRTGTDAFSPLNRLANGIWAPLMFFLWSSNDVGMLGLSMHHHGYLFHLWLRGLLMINTCMCTIDVMEVMHYFDSGAEGGEGFQPFTKVNLTLAPGTGNVLIVPNVSDSMKKQISQLTGKDLKLQQIDNQQQTGGSSLSSFGGMGSNVQAQQFEDTLQITMKIPASALQAAAKQQGFDSKSSGSGSSDFDSDIQDKDSEFDSFDSFDSDSFAPQKKQQKFETQQDQTIKGGLSKRKNII